MLDVKDYRQWVMKGIIAPFCLVIMPGLIGIDVAKATEASASSSTNAFLQFSNWLGAFAAESNSIESARIIEAGRKLAVVRRDVLLRMIKSDPRQALEKSLWDPALGQLPLAISTNLERYVEGIGDLDVFCADPTPGGPDVETYRRYVTIKGEKFHAYVYGRRTGQTTKRGIPLRGLAIGDVMAIDESSLHPIQTSKEIAAQAGGKILKFRSFAHFQQVEEQLEAAEAGLGPEASMRATNVANGDGAVRMTPAAGGPGSTWTTGIKKVIIIRVDFSDLPGDPEGLTASAVQTIADGQIGAYYLASSYGLTSLSNTVTPVYRMPQSAAYYATNYAINQLMADAQTAAAPSYNNNITQFDRVIVFFSSLTLLPNSQINWGGLSSVGGPAIWVNGLFNFEIVAHELGHTYGLFHANLWQVSDGDPISASGSSSEYHDDFDTMGGNYGNDRRTDFNPWFKSMLGWFATNQIQSVTASGTYRLNRYDIATAAGLLALKIARDNRSYWVGYKGNFTNNTSLQTGAYIVWGYDINRQSDLLDTATPGGSDQDAGLALGSSLADPAANLTISMVGQGVSGGKQYIDVKVQYGASPPTIYTQPRNQTVTSGQSGFFQVQANGVPIPGYRWQRKAGGTGSWAYVTNNATYGGALISTLAINSVTASMNGDLFQCILTNSAGAVTTAPPVALAVIPVGVTTIAGLAGSLGQADGTNNSARFDFPAGVAADGFGNVYVADRSNYTIRRVTPQGVVTTIAGLARSAGSNDGTNSSARFNFPMGICIDGAGNLYVTDLNNETIRKLTPVGTNWVVTTIAGRAGAGGNADGSGTNALFYSPAHIAVDPATNLFVADHGNQSVRQIRPAGTNWVVSTLSTNFLQLNGVCVNRAGTVFALDDGVNAVFRVLPNGRTVRIAGSGAGGNQDGPALQASFESPSGIASDILGNLYVSDASENTIRCLSTNGMVSTIAGHAGVGGAADGPLTNATFNIPLYITMDPVGNIYVADFVSHTIRKIVMGPPISLPRLDGIVNYSNSFRFVLDGPVGINYYLQTSSDLANWSVRSTNVIPAGGWLTIQDSLTNAQGRFYRASTQLPIGQNQ